MSSKPISLTEFIFQEEKAIPDLSGNLTLLLNRFQYAAKIIAAHVRQTGLVDIVGLTGQKNTFAEEVKKIDILSNDILLDVMRASGQVASVATEELLEPVEFDPAAPFTVFIDPLDGSGNIDVNAPVGTIFSVYRNTGTLLHKGEDQLAAGYILYGMSTMFVYTVGKEVNGFTLDPLIGSFVLSHPSMTIPASGTLYSLNEAKVPTWEESAKMYLHQLKAQGLGQTLRYSGAMVADLHRLLLKGGVFMYPADSTHPDGKLRLMYEVKPLSFLIKQAGGMALSRGDDPLSLTPSSVHQQVPIVLGSTENVQLYRKVLDEIHR